MEEKINQLSTLHQLLDFEVGRLMSCELQLGAQFDEWINRAGSVQLKGVLRKYQSHVQDHLQKLERFMTEQKLEALPAGDPVMQTFIEDTNTTCDRCSDIETRDACLLASIQSVNHFKISKYGTAAAFARELSIENASSLFHEMEITEKQIDDRLSQLAEFEINRRARSPIVIQQP